MPTPPVSSLPTDYAAALRSIDELPPRADVFIHRIAAPAGLAPHAAAFAATVIDGRADALADAEDESLGTARLVMLFDPRGQAGWSGPFRIVAYFQAPVETDLGFDALLPDVAWSWLTDALTARQAEHDALSGTVTRVLSHGFGELAHNRDAAQLEIRASWSPVGTQAGPHVEAWADTLCFLAGIPPNGTGVSFLRRRRQEP